MGMVTIKSPDGSETACVSEADWKDAYSDWSKVCDGLPLESEQGEKWKAVKDERASAATGVLETSFGPVQIDPASREEIGAMARLAARVDMPAIEWTMADNSVRTFTSAEFLQMDTEIIVYRQAAFTRARRLRESIGKAKSVRSVAGIRHRQGWPAKGKP